MERSRSHIERRRAPRLAVDLPLEYRVLDLPYAHGGIVVNASETGFLVNSVKNIPVGTKLTIAVWFPKEYELTSFELAAEVVWKDYHLEEDWEGYQYGLKFVNILKEDLQKLTQLLEGRIKPHETSSQL